MKKSNIKHRDLTKIFPLLIIIFLLLFLNHNRSYAQETYVKSTEIKCEDIFVKIKTECLSDSMRSFHFCISQEILLISANDARSIRIPVSGILTKTNFAPLPILNALVSEIACVKGYKKSYLIIGYYTGGNCAECEWDEIFDLDGNKLVSSKGIRGSYEKFNKTCEELGLPKKWPSSLFVHVNLMKDK
jgi:hypothetical protein